MGGKLRAGRWIVKLVSGDEYFVNLDYRNGRREDL